MDSEQFALLLPLLLAIIMVGLGTEVKLKNFFRLMLRPKILFWALCTQLVFLPFIAFLICITLKPEPILSVGLMLLAASPGGATARLFSSIFHADLDLNTNLTTLNIIISLFTMPFVVNISMLYFLPQHLIQHFPLDQFFLIFSATLLPLCFGVLIARYAASWAEKIGRPIRIFYISALILLLAGAVIHERANMMFYISSVGIACALFCFCSFFSGYIIPQLAHFSEAQARACAFHIGIHNTAVPMTIAISILHHVSFAIPAAIYTLFMYIFATVLGLVLSNRARRFILGHDISSS